MNNKICMKEFIPDKIQNSNNNGIRYDLQIQEDDFFFIISYRTQSYNNGYKDHYSFVRKEIDRCNETFEVLGLLQAEMGKQLDGKVCFCNHEYGLINKVIKWFDKQFDFSKDT